jgi:CheY-like chemotaxis protein
VLALRDSCLAAGMNDYLRKPIQADQLFSAIQRVVECTPPINPELTTTVSNATTSADHSLDAA